MHKFLNAGAPANALTLSNLRNVGRRADDSMKAVHLIRDCACWYKMIIVIVSKVGKASNFVR